MWLLSLASRGRLADPSLPLPYSPNLLPPLGAVLRAALLPVLDALRVEPAADHDDRVLLQIVAFARNITDDLEAIGQPHFRDLAQSRVRLLGRGRVDAGTDAALLRRCSQMARLFPVDFLLPRLADQLADRRHSSPFQRR